jgi:peptidoglycan/xylan/chitin deacetylase (PgdA/CDA1 family)
VPPGESGDDTGSGGSASGASGATSGVGAGPTTGGSAGLNGVGGASAASGSGASGGSNPGSGGAATTGGTAGQAGSGFAGSGNAGSGNAGSGNAGSGNAGSGNAGSGNAGSGNAGSGNGGSGNGGSGAGGAGAGGTSGNAGSAGKAGNGGSGGSGGTGGSGVGPGPSGLPPPPGSSNVPKPSGTAGNLTVLNWAGFKGAVTYSFDDSNDSQISNYSTLEGLGVPFTFFMWTGKSQASNSIWGTAIKDGHEIGNHTMSHDPTSHCTAADVTSATQFIQSKWGVKAWTMAAPNGNTCYKPLAQGVFFINRGVSPATPVMPLGNSDPLNLNCYIPNQGQQASTFNANVDDGHSKGGWVIYVVHGFTGDGSAYQPVDLAQLTSAINYTKSLGDMWIGTMETVGAYWLGQKAFSQAMTATAGSNKTWTWTLPGQFPTGKYLRVKVDGGTLTQKGVALTWDPHGYYEIALDAGSVTLGP